MINNAIELISKKQEKFPKILLKQTVASNFDLFFVLLVYLDKYKYSTISEEELNKIASSYVYILWFHKDIKSGINRLFKLLFAEENLSWSNALSILIQENLVLLIIEPQLLKKQLNLIVAENQIDSNHITIIKEKNLFLDEIKTKLFFVKEDENTFIENWNSLINRVYWNKSLIIYAQKDYMNLKFKEFNQFENIEDTNRPWDWDHIYPISWVYNKVDINQLVRSWVNCIGNFRALSYDDNRSENNHLSPKQRFENDNKKEESFIKENDLQFWNQIDQTFGKIKHNEPEKTKIFLSAVINRMVNIYADWYENYFINYKKY
ncbi:MAG: hypothetical protein RL528_426 [Bacteroidota bacterium]